MMQRVLFLDHAGVLGGAELSLLRIAEHYAGSCKVVLFSDGPFRERLEKSGVDVEVLSVKRAITQIKRGGLGIAQLKAIPGVMSLVRQIIRRSAMFDVLVANSQKAFAVSSMVSWWTRKPLVWYLRDIISADHFSRFNRALVVWLANRFASRIIANSKATKDAFVQCGGRAELVSVVYNGIEGAAFSSLNDAEVREMRAQLGLNSKPVVAVFSRLAPWKGQHVLIDALPQLPSVQALLVGAPLFGDEIRYQQELEARTRANGIVDRVQFLGFREDIPKLLQIADVVVHTSVAPEPFGRVIVEGMLAKKPVVATRAGGACEIIQDGVTGRLVTPGDSGELARVIAEVLGDPYSSRKLAQAGCDSARERFSVMQMVDGIAQVIRAAVRI